MIPKRLGQRDDESNNNKVGGETIATARQVTGELHSGNVRLYMSTRLSATTNKNLRHQQASSGRISGFLLMGHKDATTSATVLCLTKHLILHTEVARYCRIRLGLRRLSGLVGTLFFSPGYIYGDFCRSSGGVAMLDAGLLVAASALLAGRSPRTMS